MRAATKAISTTFYSYTTSAKFTLSQIRTNGVSAVAGTHTNARTADEQVLPWRNVILAILACDSTLGWTEEAVLSHFLTRRSHYALCWERDGRLKKAVDNQLSRFIDSRY